MGHNGGNGRTVAELKQVEWLDSLRNAVDAGDKRVVAPYETFYDFSAAGGAGDASSLVNNLSDSVIVKAKPEAITNAVVEVADNFTDMDAFDSSETDNQGIISFQING